MNFLAKEEIRFIGKYITCLSGAAGSVCKCEVGLKANDCLSVK